MSFSKFALATVTLVAALAICSPEESTEELLSELEAKTASDYQKTDLYANDVAMIKAYLVTNEIDEKELDGFKNCLTWKAHTTTKQTDSAAQIMYACQQEFTNNPKQFAQYPNVHEFFGNFSAFSGEYRPLTVELKTTFRSYEHVNTKYAIDTELKKAKVFVRYRTKNELEKPILRMCYAEVDLNNHDLNIVFNKVVPDYLANEY